MPLRLLISLVTVLTIIACGSGDEGSDSEQSESTGTSSPVRSAELAPELVGIDNWYNTEPLSLEALRGSPVLLVFFRDT